MTTQTTFQIAGLLEKMTSNDKDYRYMATNDLMSELGKDSIKLDEDSEKKVVRMLLKLLEDKNGEVQNLAVKCLGPLVNKVKDHQVEAIVDTLCSNMKSPDKERLREVSSLGLKTVIHALPPSSSALASNICRRITPQLCEAINQGDVSVQLEALDILADLLLRYGSVLVSFHTAIQETLMPQLSNSRPAVRKRTILALSHLVGTCSNDVFSKIMSMLIDELRTNAPVTFTTRTYVNCLASLCRAAGHRFGEHLGDIMPLLIAFCEKEDDELREFCIQAFESFVVRCPHEIAQFVSQIVDICSRFISYDPNYHYDDGDSGMNGDASGGSDYSGSESEQEYTDDEDMSWKVRRAAAKCLEAILVTRRELLLDFYMHISPLLISRLKESLAFADMSWKVRRAAAKCLEAILVTRRELLLDFYMHISPLLISRLKESLAFADMSWKVRRAAAKCLEAILVTRRELLLDFCMHISPLLISRLKESLAFADMSWKVRRAAAKCLEAILVTRRELLLDFCMHISPLLISRLKESLAFADMSWKVRRAAAKCLEAILVTRRELLLDFYMHISPLLISRLKESLAFADMSWKVRRAAAKCLEAILVTRRELLLDFYMHISPLLISRLKESLAFADMSWKVRRAAAKCLEAILVTRRELLLDFYMHISPLLISRLKESLAFADMSWKVRRAAAKCLEAILVTRRELLLDFYMHISPLLISRLKESLAFADMSWKVRRAAAKCLEAILVTRRELLLDFYMHISPLLISRLKESLAFADMSWKVRRAAAKCLEAILVTRRELLLDFYMHISPLLISRLKESLAFADMSWKVRRAAAKCLEAILVTRRELLLDFYTHISPLLISRFKEREENVKADVFAAYTALLRHTKLALPASDMVTMEGNDEVQELRSRLSAEVPKIVNAVTKQLKEKSPKTRQCCFALLNQLILVLPGALAPHMGPVVQGITHSLAEKTSTQTMKIETLNFLLTTLQTHNPEVFQEQMAELVPKIVLAVDDSFYKVTAEALAVIQELMRAMRLADDMGFDYSPYVNKIYDPVLIRLKASDIDQEVKEKAIACAGQFVATFGDQYPEKMAEVMPLLMDRLRNEITRLTCVRALLNIVTSPFPVDISYYIPEVILELSGFLRKNQRVLRLSTLELLSAVSADQNRHAVSFDGEGLHKVLIEVPPLLSEQDMQISQMAIGFLGRTLTSNKMAVAEVLDKILEQLSKLVLSPLLQGASLSATLNFLQGLMVANLPKLNFDNLVAMLVQPITDLNNVHKAGYRNTAKAVAVLCAHNQRGCKGVIQNLVSSLENKKTSESVMYFSLLALGEIGLICPEAVRGIKPERLMIDAFNSKKEDIQKAASHALGLLAAGNLAEYMPFLFNQIETHRSRQYLLLIALKEIINAESNDPGRVDIIRPYIPKIWQVLMAHAECNEEGTRNVVSECLGKLTLLDPDNLLPKLAGGLKLSSHLARATTITALKFTIVDQPQPIDSYLKVCIGDFLKSLGDPDLIVRRVALVTTNSAAHNKPMLIRDLLVDLLPPLYEETIFRPDRPPSGPSNDEQRSTQ